MPWVRGGAWSGAVGQVRANILPAPCAIWSKLNTFQIVHPYFRLLLEKILLADNAIEAGAIEDCEIERDFPRSTKINDASSSERPEVSCVAHIGPVLEGGQYA